jgi:hypothetical protein
MQFASEERGEPKIHSLSPLMHLRACGRSELGGVRVAGARWVATREARAERLRRRTGADAGHAKEERRAGGARRAAGGGASDGRGQQGCALALGLCRVQPDRSLGPHVGVQALCNERHRTTGAIHGGCGRQPLSCWTPAPRPPHRTPRCARRVGTQGELLQQRGVRRRGAQGGRAPAGRRGEEGRSSTAA